MTAANINRQTYFMDDSAITVPDGFRDRSVHVLEWTTPTHETIALVVGREVLRRRHPDEPISTEDLETFVESQTRGLPTQFAGFRSERDESGVTAAGVPFHRMAFRWKKDAEVFYHHQAFVLLGERVIALTSSAKARQREQVDFLLERALENIRRRRGV